MRYSQYMMHVCTTYPRVVFRTKAENKTKERARIYLSAAQERALYPTAVTSLS